MLVGVMLAASHDHLLKYYRFLDDNNYRMGDGEPGAALLKPNMLGVLGRVLGKDLAPRFPYLPNDKDYVRHIQALMIYLDVRSTGFIREQELELLKRYDDGKDYLILSLIARYSGKYDKAYKVLLEQPKPPTYVRGDEPERYRLAHWLFSANLLLRE